MAGFLFIILFLAAGAASFWFGFDLIPENILQRFSNIENAKFMTAGFGALLGLLTGLLFQKLSQTLLDQCLL